MTKLSRFHGCMQQIFIDDEPVDIDVMLQRKWGRYAEILLGTCGITDRCVFVWVGFGNTVLAIIEACKIQNGFIKSVAQLFKNDIYQWEVTTMI